jgi:16S rRNA A1518/A1519 N6-dimethyltransferase RsmA/KsgA/DIM1 with predicted DNA glycosylase/AP lyase activity
MCKNFRWKAICHWNFPYNISTQIVFRTLEYRNQIPEFSGMFPERSSRNASVKEGNKKPTNIICFGAGIL